MSDGSKLKKKKNQFNISASKFSWEKLNSWKIF